MLLITFSASSVCAKDYNSKEVIQSVQQALNEAGFNCGTPDGVAGTKTAEAISQFRANQSLPAGTEIDSQLCQALGLELSEEEIKAHASYTVYEDSPEGIDVVYWKFDNIKYPVIARFTNNTGKDIHFEVTCYYANGNDVFGAGYVPCKYFKASEDFYAVFSIGEMFDNFALDYYSEGVSPSVKEDLDALEIRTERRANNSIFYSIHDTNGAGYNGEFTVFYFDEYQNVIGCKSIGFGGSGTFEDVFDAPPYEYDSYVTEYLSY